MLWFTVALKLQVHGLNQIAEQAEIDDNNHGNALTLPEIKIINANYLQCVIIGINLEYLLMYVKGTLPPDSEPLRLLIQGTAGTGKSFVITALTRITRRVYGRNYAVMNLAPTGASAVLIPDGRTIHSKTPPPRKIKKDKDTLTMQLSDYPLSE